jgi:hypothetical protein
MTINVPEPKTVTNAALDKLPLFATDLEIAVAIVGKQNASRWRRDVLPELERKGFPGYDHLHYGRPVPLVKQFYALYFGITAGITLAKPDGKEKLGQWSRRGSGGEERRAAISSSPDRSGVIPPPTTDERRVRAKAASDAWAEKKRKALEKFNAKKAAEAEAAKRRNNP